MFVSQKKIIINFAKVDDDCDENCDESNKRRNEQLDEMVLRKRQCRWTETLLQDEY